MELSGSDRKLLRTNIENAFTASSMKRLIGVTHPSLLNELPLQGNWSDLAAEVIEEANRQGVLDRILTEAVAERPHVENLRALELFFSVRTGWTTSVESHGFNIKAGLELLTSPGNPFLDTSRLARFIIRTERQVCRVRCAGQLGTGFLVGPDLVMTCYHVVKDHLHGSVSTVEVLFDYRRDESGKDPEEDPNAWIDIDTSWEIPQSPYSVSDITLIGEPATNELDYALLKLSRTVGSETPPGEEAPRGWVDASKDPNTPPVDDPILIVQHPEMPGSHPPSQQPLQFAMTTPGFDGLNASGTRVKYRPSTLPGSSGSPVFDRSLSVVALHHNRGQINPQAINLTLNNRGIPLGRIRADLTSAVRDLMTAPP